MPGLVVCPVEAETSDKREAAVSLAGAETSDKRGAAVSLAGTETSGFVLAARAVAWGTELAPGFAENRVSVAEDFDSLGSVVFQDCMVPL
jgi:hypothetical protein